MNFNTFLLFLIYITLIMLVDIVTTNKCEAKHIHTERWYQERSCSGEIEYRLPDGKRIDCLTITHAIEHDFANKAYECIGQALYYSSQTDKSPGCKLIIEDPERDCKYLKIITEVNSMLFKPITLWTVGEECGH